MVHGTKIWNRAHIHQLFSGEEAEAILRMPLMNSGTTDTRIWSYEKLASSSVISGYHVFMERFGNIDSLKFDGNLMSFWKLHVPPKVKVFLWRVCRDCIPTRIRLQSRGVPCLGTCVGCSTQLENMWYALLTCEFRIKCWCRGNLWHTIEPLFDTIESFEELFFWLCELCNSRCRNQFAMLLWAIWRGRNEKL